jgi:hypothetical protein
MIKVGNGKDKLFLRLEVDKCARRAGDEEDGGNADGLSVRDASGYCFARDRLMEELPHLFVGGYRYTARFSTSCNVDVFYGSSSPLLGTFPTHMTHSLRLAGAAGW